jgi:flagellar basal body-associated protein FliL
MTYIDKEKSSFMPIFMALSIATVVGFGVMYFMFSKMPSDNADADSPLKTSAPAAVQTLSKSAHTHV